MALHASMAFQNITSAAPGAMPAMSAALKPSLQGLLRPQSASGGSLPTRAAAVHTASGSRANAHTSVLPAFFKTVPLAALRPSVGLGRPAPTVSDVLSAAPSNALLSDNSILRNLLFRRPTSRQFSTTSRLGLSSNLRSVQPQERVGLSKIQQRTLFGSKSPYNQLADLELAANTNRSNAAAQAKFYGALLNAGMHQIIVDRYRSGRFARSPAIDRIYQTALQGTGQTHGISYQASGNGQLTPEQMQAVEQAVQSRQTGAINAAQSGVKGDPIYVVIEESLFSTISKWIRWLLGFGLAAWVALIVITLMVESTGFMKKVSGGGTAEVRPEQQTTRFSDVHGCDEAKEELQDVVDFLKNPDRYNKLGGRLPKGVLLIGPPGTGKTLLARAVAGEAGVPFFYMSGSEFDEVYVGVGAKRVRELFQAARTKAPAIVFIDELDAVGGKRKSRDANYHRQTLNQLLNDLDGFDQSTGVIFIAATNHPEILDKALLRPGRFDRHISVDLPDVRGRMAILKHHTKKIRLAPDVDLSKIARGTPGFSGAELENLANTAAIHASKHLSKFVNVQDLEWAKDKIMLGSERKSRIVPLNDKLHTAYHEGGHTLVGLYTKGFNDVHKATILPRGAAAGITFFLPKENEQHRLKSQYLVELAISMGGRMAEEIVYGAANVGDGASGDIQNATQMAYAMVTSYGFSDLLGDVDYRSTYEHVSPETRRLIDNEVRRLIEEAKANARKILTERRHELDLLAKALVQYETLDKDEIVKVVKGEKLPDRLMAAPGAQIKIPEPSDDSTSTPAPPVVLPGNNNSDDPDPPSGSSVPA